MLKLRLAPALLLAIFFVLAVSRSFIAADKNEHEGDHWQSVDNEIAQKGLHAGQLLGKDRLKPDQLKEARELGYLYWQAHRLTDAAAIFRKLWQLDVQSGEQSLYNKAFVSDARDLGSVCMDLAAFTDALYVYEHLLDYDTRALGARHAQVACDLNNLGIAYYMSGNCQTREVERIRRWEQARACLNRAREILAASGKALSADQAYNLLTLSLIERDLGQIEDGRTAAKQAEAILAAPINQCK